MVMTGRWRRHGHLVNALQTIWKSWSAQIVGKVDGEHLRGGTWRVLCLEILDVLTECSSLQCCSVCLVPKQRDKYHGRAFSSGRGTILSKAVSFFPCLSTSIHFEYLEEQIKCTVAKFFPQQGSRRVLGLCIHVCFNCQNVFCTNLFVGGEEKVNEVVMSIWIEVYNVVALTVTTKSLVKNLWEPMGRFNSKNFLNLQIFFRYTRRLVPFPCS